MTDAIELPQEVRMERVLSVAFRGIHHCPRLKKEYRNLWTVTVSPISTWDFDQLTRLVIAAHHYGVRVEIEPGGPRRIKLVLTPRSSRDGCFSKRHPTIQQAIAALNLEGRNDPPSVVKESLTPGGAQ